MKEKITIIDADSLTFYSSKDTIEDSIGNIKERLDYILEVTEATKFVICLTGRRDKNFRYILYPEYKANRKKRYGQPLKYLKTLKAFLVEEYNALIVDEVEADDLVAYFGAKLKTADTDTTICSPDKDVVHQLVGKHWNYSYKKINKDTPEEYIEKGRWVETSQEESDRFFALQMLMGDSGDNIKGIAVKTDYMKKKFGLNNRAGVGEATANKILDYIDAHGGNYANEIVLCYTSKYEGDDAPTKGFEDYTLNRKLLQLHTNDVPPYKRLTNWAIEEHINEVLSTPEWEIEIDKNDF
jgi:5'-3' exonuclease